MAIYKRRQQFVEHPFGIVLFTMYGNHFLLRTQRKVRAEVALLFLGYNMKRAKEILGFEGVMARLDALIALVAAEFHVTAVRMLFFLSHLRKSICFFLLLRAF